MNRNKIFLKKNYAVYIHKLCGGKYNIYKVLGIWPPLKKIYYLMIQKVS